jgi:hypothetical protein
LVDVPEEDKSKAADKAAGRSSTDATASGATNGLLVPLPPPQHFAPLPPSSPLMKRANKPSATAVGAPRTPKEELQLTEQQYVAALKDVRDDFFPRVRGLVSANEGKALFNNWGELVPFHEVHRGKGVLAVVGWKLMVVK